MDTSPPTPAPQLRVARTIIAAMGAGIITFLAAALFLVETGRMQPDPLIGKTILPLLGVMTAGALAAYAGVRTAFLRRLAITPPPDAPRLAPASVAQVANLAIIGGALAEGTALFGVVCYLLTGNRWALTAVGFELLVLALLWPTEGKLQRLVQYNAPTG